MTPIAENQPHRPVRSVPVWKVHDSGDTARAEDGRPPTCEDIVAVEDPLEIHLNGERFVLTMRTPGRDRQLAIGFLFAEGVIGSQDDIRSLNPSADGGVVDVALQPGATARLASHRLNARAVTTTSACGVCGRTSIDDLMAGIQPVHSSRTLGRAAVLRLPAALRDAQLVFDQTGGLHAAGLFDPRGTMIAAAEDVGRHNAVDKVIGQALLEGLLPLTDHLLFVSGRTSFEIVQKAAVAGVGCVAAVSAPSSLAIEVATAARMALIGFVRPGRFNVYAGSERIDVS